MLSCQKYVGLSLELHLFFARIMKEHAIFLKAGFTPKNTKLSREADDYKLYFEKFLLDTVKLSDGVIRKEVLKSGELFTDYTLSAECKTQFFTGIKINENITKMESRLDCGRGGHIKSRLEKSVRQLNKRAKKLVEGFIDLKVRVLNGVLSCELFTTNYPLLIEHIIDEAKLYRSCIIDLENGRNIEERNIRESEMFWDHIMMEHALFIRGTLDPSENDLIKTSDKFSKEYAKLLQRGKSVPYISIDDITRESLDETVKFKEFKKSGAEGVNKCKIRSIILPLLSDHVLREANHYIRLLKKYECEY